MPNSDSSAGNDDLQQQSAKPSRNAARTSSLSTLIGNSNNNSSGIPRSILSTTPNSILNAKRGAPVASSLPLLKKRTLILSRPGIQTSRIKQKTTGVISSKPAAVTKTENAVKPPAKGKEDSDNNNNNNINNKVDSGKDLDKSWMMAQDIIKLHKERETQYTQQIMTLNTEKSQLEQSKQELQQTVSQLERKTHEMELQISDLKHNAQLNGEKHNYTIELHMKDLVHKHEVEMNDLERRYKEELDLAVKDIKREAKEVVEREQESFLSKLDTKEKEFQKRLQQEQEASRTSLESANRLNNERESSWKNQQAQFEKEVKRLETDNQNWDSKFSALQNEMKIMKADLSKHQTDAATGFSRYESEIRQLQHQVKENDENLADLKNQLAISKAEEELAKEKLFLAETVRRKLHNQLQELKGNIRVFCRVRPLLEDEASPVDIVYPDINAEGQQLQIVSNNGDSDSTTRIHSFSFDKVFDPSAPNQTVFEEVSHLVQSALDGFNVCIFAYGQTGSGKTFTMSSSKTGVIPLAVSQIFNTAERLKELNWEYKFQGEFLEIYNERIIDLLKPQDDLENNTFKYEIRHDTAARSTTVTGLTSTPLSTPAQANEVLERAARNRSVAATLANERSSRSHSVFILRLVGRNSETGETRTGVLNLIDLAGSERLAHSQAVGDRLKETQAINRSLSSLGDVICALGNSNALHIPYRNSKLTYLLQYSLSGNSKTLMLVNVSPLQAHVNESINSLRFATKVNNTHVGSAKRLQQ